MTILYTYTYIDRILYYVVSIKESRTSRPCPYVKANTNVKTIAKRFYTFFSFPFSNEENPSRPRADDDLYFDE